MLGNSTEYRSPKGRVNFFTTSVLFLAITGLLFVEASWKHSIVYGSVLYPLDDSYIHLAIAKSLAESGTWGISPGNPSAASSSPLWTIILAAAASLLQFLGSITISWVPFIGNVVAGIALIWFWGRRFADTPFPRASTILLILVVPLPAIALIGMEHVLHAFLATVLAWTASEQIEEHSPPNRRAQVTLALLSGLTVAARYESLALVGAIAVLAVWHRQWRIVPAIVLPPVVVLAGFGLVWVHGGGWLVPNSLLLKTTLGSMGGQMTVNNVYLGPPMISNLIVTLGLVLAVLAVLLTRRNIRERGLVILALAATLGQYLAGGIGWLFRYEAWLIALDVFAIVCASSVLLGDRPKVFAAVLAGLALACLPRAETSLLITPMAAQDREWEHFGPTRALATYANRAILVNDVGVVGYFGGLRPVDIYGLADNRSLRLKRAGHFDSLAVQKFARSVGASVGEVQICWAEVNARFPVGWSLVEVWKGPRNVVFGDRLVAFMAADQTEAMKLAGALGNAHLPDGVQRFTITSPELRRFNAANDKPEAANKLCNALS